MAAVRIAWSLHTWRIYDTSRSIAHREVLLETPAGASELAQHLHGMTWLSEGVEAGILSWLHTEQQVPEGNVDCYRAVAGLRGDLLAKEMPRHRPQP